MKSIRVGEAPQQTSWRHSVTIEPRFDALIERLEQTAHAHPDRYRWSVMFAGMLGYLVIATLLAFGAYRNIWHGKKH